MWSYYGAKTTFAKSYPTPKHEKIIEHFAGTGRYALEHFERDVLLVDKYEVIIRIWEFLQQCSPKDITGLPKFEAGDMIDKFNYSCEAERALVGFMGGYGLTHPANRVSPGINERPRRIENSKRFIAENLYRIRHWKFLHGDYNDTPNELATHFIDPPYQFGGHKYAHSSKKIDFDHLAEFCRTREGQVIVCENTKADWLPFVRMKRIKGAQGMSVEAIWSNEPTVFDNQQQSLLL